MDIFDWIDSIGKPGKVANRQLYRAWKSIEQKNYGEALTILSQVIRLELDETTLPKLYLYRGYTYIQTDEYDLAIADFNRALELNDPDPAQIYFYRAVAFARKRRRENLKAAIADYGEALRLGLEMKRAVEALLHRGLLLYWIGDYKRAEANYRELIRLNSGDLDEPYSMLGFINLQQKDYIAAIENYSQAIALNPQRARNYADRGYAYIRERDWERALADLNEAIRLSPEDVYALNNRGEVFLQTGDLQAALSDYRRGVEIDPRFYPSYAGLAHVQFTLGEADAALANLKRADEIKPDYEAIQALLAVTHHALNQVDEALAIWKKLIEKNANYYKADWLLTQDYMWTEPLIEEARKLIAHLQD